jgi:hypothetical protein
MQAHQGFQRCNIRFAIPLPVQYDVCIAVCMLYICIQKNEHQNNCRLLNAPFIFFRFCLLPAIACRTYFLNKHKNDHYEKFH